MAILITKIFQKICLSPKRREIVVRKNQVSATSMGQFQLQN